MKGYDQARGRTRVNIGAAFQWWRELKEREGLESDADVSNVDFALFHTTYLCWLLFEYTVCLCIIFTCFRDHCYARVVYVLVGWR